MNLLKTLFNYDEYVKMHPGAKIVDTSGHVHKKIAEASEIKESIAEVCQGMMHFVKESIAEASEIKEAVLITTETQKNTFPDNILEPVNELYAKILSEGYTLNTTSHNREANIERLFKVYQHIHDYLDKA